MKGWKSGNQRSSSFTDRSKALWLLLLGTIAWAQGSLAPTGPAARGEGAAHPVPTFAKVVQDDFAHWDLNHDGRLEAKEVDELINRKGIHRYAAAALATIKRYDRMEPEDKRTEYAPSEEELVSKHPNEEALQPRDTAQGKPRVYHFESQFRHNLTVLASINRKLYAGNGPNFAAMHQGPVGDCYFFSVTGYLAACDRDRLMRMIVAEPSGSFVVHFGDGEKFPVPAPTDAEILLNNSSSSLEDGIWLTVLEKAIGEKRRLTAKPDMRTGEATDAMAHGGSTGKVMQWYSGHELIDIKLRDPAQAEARLAQMRQLLPPALASRRLVAVSMGKEPPAEHKKIPHLGYSHSYAIFDYDPRSDQVTVWNPWGNDFKPSGRAGIENGFETKHGIFRLPLKTLYEQFSNFHVETSKPLPAAGESHAKPVR